MIRPPIGISLKVKLYKLINRMTNNNPNFVNFRQTTFIIKQSSGHITAQMEPPKANQQLLASLPPLYPEWLGDRTFQQTHGVRFPYVAGSMANGISSTRMVIALAEVGILSFFGAAGLAYDKVANAVQELKIKLDPLSAAWGCNLIHSPNEPELEARVAELFIQQGVHKVSASAYMQLTPAIVRYACAGLYQDKQGQIHRRHHVFAKISRPETARLFMSPAPEAILQSLLASQQLTEQEVSLARKVPLAEDITVEADSGGHTDNQALPAIFPTIALLRDQLCQQYQYQKSIRVGAAGGLGSPQAIAGAFAMGAAYVLTGTVNQACIESGLSTEGKAQLALAKVGDVTMTPASDMFEQGVKLQVLKKGTLYPTRAAKLYTLYVQYNSIDAIPETQVKQLETQIFQKSMSQVWQETQQFWQQRDVSQLEKAANDPKHKMALIFRSYLGLSSRWAMAGTTERKLDYQIWCGPAIAAFNQWTAGSFLENPQQRTVVQVALNLLEGAATCMRISQLRTYGVHFNASDFNFTPRPIQEQKHSYQKSA